MAGSTPKNPETYLPVPGQTKATDSSNADSANADRIAKQNTGVSDPGQTSNDIRIDTSTGTGKRYLSNSQPASQTIDTLVPIGSAGALTVTVG